MSVLNKIISLPGGSNSNNNNAAIWIYNEYLDSCLYEKINKWYIDENDYGIILRSAINPDICISVITNENVLDNCGGNNIMYYNKGSKFINSDDGMCLGVNDDEDYLTLNNCNRNNKKILWEISESKPTVTTTTTTTTTINSTPTSKPV
ncbi:hypothetical protein BCR32DRAFT_287214 [Anaeromyces robustus]|uniref:Ricin B lectin domain-containing protein n=1 Tax=Anaeromyces robustus TaxID=1754192 RepID=A0A1Y1VTC6_9FUNG|nr:hypothetical protein BCR32DRAFT_287214 [Anaeromyces robustus]|eukprot:ORX64265.1 hypothetical protein BCR32DRAFT_287214 [Anaeromyces robustus]